MSAVGLQSPNRLPFTVFFHRVATCAGSWMVRSVKPPHRMSTTMPDLPITANASVIVSRSIAPGGDERLVRADAAGELLDETVGLVGVGDACVAPNSRAFSRLNAIGSTATTSAAPANRAPCTALIPIPPTP